jgi:hypothetical protein
MPHYIPAMLHKFQHARPTKHQGAPHTWTTPSYGAKVQYAPSDDDSPILAPSDITTIQQKIGTLLYYAVSVDPFMLAALGTIACSQAKATQLTKDKCSWLMDYVASNPLSIIRYHASDMTLYVHSDASYLSETHARSRGAGHFFLSPRPKDPTAPPEVMPTLNGPVHTMCKFIDVVVGSAAEAEIGAGYLNGQDAVPIITTLTELGHPQPPTPMQVDNTMAKGFANGTMKQKKSKAMDMRWHWLKCRERQGQFLVYYQPGKENVADPFTKHHTPAHLYVMTPKFLRRTEQLVHAVIHHLVQGCVTSVTPNRTRVPSVRPRVPSVCSRTQRPYTEMCPHNVASTNKRKIVPAPSNWSSRVAH